MTKFQALYVLYLRHQDLQDNSWRMLAFWFYYRYDRNFKLKSYQERFPNDVTQLEGIELERKAFEILRPDRLFREPIDLYECDLTLIEANLKRHTKYIK
jgi:hypothetical protein